MATINVTDARRGRALDHDLPLLPFIDFMLCLVAFLMVTAEWSQMARLQAFAAGGHDSSAPTRPESTLHVSVGEKDFNLSWRDGSTVLETKQLARHAVPAADGSPRYPDLASLLTSEWQSRGAHRATSDLRQDRAVLHTNNSTSFGELAAVMDAVSSPHRAVESNGKRADIAAFALSFASD